MTKKEIDLISSQGKAVYNKFYQDEFGTTYIGARNGRVIRYIAPASTPVVNQTTATSISSTTTTTPSISLDNLTDVTLTSPVTGEALVYNGTDWVNQSTSGTGTVTSVQLTAGTGVSLSGTNPITSSGNITITNTAPDQTVSLTAGTGINVTGSYPSFTVTNSSPSSGGTVTSIATSSPITGGTITGSGTIGITQATTSTNGYLSSTDWNTFNNKQAALTNPVTGTGTNNQIAYFNTTGSTIGSLTTGTYPSLTELSYVKGVTSAVQTQINAKEPTLTKGNLTEATSSVLTISGGSNAVIGSGTSIQVKQSSGSQSGFLSSTDWTTFNNKQATVSLTTTGTSGVSTFASNTLNIPQYANGDSQNVLYPFGLLGSSMKGYNVINPAGQCYTTATITSSNLYLSSYYLPIAYTITGVKWYQSTLQAGNANYNGVALYSYSGGTLTLVASSTNDANCWNQAGTLVWKTKAFSSTYSASAGIYYIGLVFNGTTAPSIGVYLPFTSTTAGNYDFTNSTRINLITSTTTSLPSSLVASSLSGGSVNFTCFLY